MSQPQRSGETKWYELTWRILRPAVIFLTACVIVVGILATTSVYAYENYVMPVDENDQAPVTVQIERGASISAIAKQLTEADLIRNKGVFQYLADFLGKSGKMKAGTYELSRNMTILQIMGALEAGDGGTDVMTFTLVEGLTVEEMGRSLVEQKVFADDKRFLELCRTGGAFKEEYPFVEKWLDGKQEGRVYALEGLLFPDTYEIYVGSNEETVIGKMLTQMNKVYGVAYMNRAEELNMDMNDIITLASIIQKEGKRDSFAKVSSVFHNRLEQNMALGSDVTIQYVLGIKDLVLTQGQLDTDSPYNTYKNKGIPIGPICNPGDEAIEAALYPDEEYLEQGYLYFTLTDPETGVLYFSKSLEEHNQQVEEFRPLWEAYDQKQKQAAQSAAPSGSAAPTPGVSASPSPGST